MTTRCRRRKCRCCQQLYEPDPRNRFHQAYCSQPACRQASKAASQRRWRESARGRDYFRGSANAQRVKAWRQAHPGYRTRRRKISGALQDHCTPQPLVFTGDKHPLDSGALQEILMTQHFVITGLIAQLTGSALQEIIASATHRLLLLGRQIQGLEEGSQSDGGIQTRAAAGPLAASSPAIQLGRSPPRA